MKERAGKVVGQAETLRDALDRLLVPVLRRRGFAGAWPHFRRPGRRRIDLVTVEVSPAEDRFRLQVALAPVGGLVTEGGRLIPPAELRADAMPAGWRTVLAPVGSDSGECLEEETDRPDRFQRAVDREVAALDWAEDWWRDRADVLLGVPAGLDVDQILTIGGGVLLAGAGLAAARRLVTSRHFGGWLATAFLGTVLLGVARRRRRH